MGLSAELQSAFSEAKTALAQAVGMSGATNALYNGQALVAVFGPPQPQNQMLPAGGWRQRTVVPFSITRAQLPGNLAKNAYLTRTDVSPHLVYRIDHLDLHDAYHHRGVLVRVGE